MEDPVREIPTVITLLTETPPSLQAKAIEKYFTPNAQFTHPFCRTGSSKYSRYLIDRIYRWYKIMSPKISGKITSISFDEQNQVLYVGMSQVFAIWAIPTHRSEVSLVTVLHLTRDYHPSGTKGQQTIEDAFKTPTTAEKNGSEEKEVANHSKKHAHRGDGKYYITSQNDLYQSDQFIKFVLPWFWYVIVIWQFVATLFCVAGSYLFYPVTWLEENYQENFKRIEQPPKWNDAR